MPPASDGFPFDELEKLQEPTVRQLAILDAAQETSWLSSFPNPYKRKELVDAENPYGYHISAQ